MSGFKKIFLFVLLFFFIPSVLFAAESPRIEKLMPPDAMPGKILIIRGAGFTTDNSKIKINFGGTPAKAITTTDKSILTKVPPGVTECDITVEIDGQVSNPYSFKAGQGTAGIPESEIAVKLTVTDPVAHIGTRITGTFTVTGTDAPLKIHFTNKSPQIVSIEGGNDQTIMTSGGKNNTYNFPINTIAGPSLYTISYNWKNFLFETRNIPVVIEKPGMSKPPKTSVPPVWEDVDLTMPPEIQK
ncbi:MAG: IPT/TIG domain-containing protein [Chloroflexi bacterium]|nr:IPT/TIG domain-containing protein [Chloroflexota bacterium]